MNVLNSSKSPIMSLVRENIRNLKPYSSARDEFKGEADIFMDANENPYPSDHNRYPDPLQVKVKEKLSRLKGVPVSQIFLGNGSDEAIDLLIRAFCEPGKDSIVITDPTYGMYSVCAGVNAVATLQVKLTPDFDLDTRAILGTATSSTKIIFVCSPNNPTGNLLSRQKIVELLTSFSGLVVVDEAYIDFADSESFTSDLAKYPNLVILQTFSKAWGLAGLRLGICFGSEEIISILNKIKYPYNISILTQVLAVRALDNVDQKNAWVKEILRERQSLVNALNQLGIVKNIFPSDANFILVRVTDAPATYRFLAEKGIIVRDRSRVTLCENCLRITVGTPEENRTLVETLKQL